MKVMGIPKQNVRPLVVVNGRMMNVGLRLARIHVIVEQLDRLDVMMEVEERTVVAAQIDVEKVKETVTMIQNASVI